MVAPIVNVELLKNLITTIFSGLLITGHWVELHVTFDQNVKNAISAEFEFLAARLPDW